MRILPISQYNFRGFLKKEPDSFVQKNPFQEGQIVNNGKVFTRHTTTFFRSDLNWEELGEYLKEKFSNQNKVQTLIWGCSTGDEAYSLAILLKRYFSKDFKKFLPIKAMDIDPKLIEKNKIAQERGFFLNGTFIEKMKNGLNMPSLHYDLYEIGKYCKLAGYRQYQLRDNIINSVEFECSNILTDIDKIDSNTPSIVMCRNMWPYIDSKQYQEYAKKLYDKLSKGSVVIVGEYDWHGDAYLPNSSLFPQTLEHTGFEPAKNVGAQNSLYVFEK